MIDSPTKATTTTAAVRPSTLRGHNQPRRGVSFNSSLLLDAGTTVRMVECRPVLGSDPRYDGP